MEKRRNMLEPPRNTEVEIEVDRSSVNQKKLSM